MARAASLRKERVTVSLSPASAAYVKRFSAEERSHVSTLFERMIEDFRHKRELVQLNENITAFYDSLPEQVTREQDAWGAVGAVGLTEMFESEIDAATPETTRAGD